MSYDLTILENGCAELGIELAQQQKDQYIQYYEYLIEKNKVMNLTGITEFQEVLTKHFLDSLSCVKAVDMTKVKTIIDIGTGAGFPGIPLKIAFPRLEMTLVDSLDKRVSFLNNVIKELSLDNCKAIHIRAEEYGHSKARESFDLCVTRAVSNLSVISEYCLPLVKPGGYFIPYKGSSVKEEISEYEIAVEELGGAIDDVAIYELPDSDIARSLILIYKDRDTPKKYPRRNGIPTKRPIS